MSADQNKTAVLDLLCQRAAEVLAESEADLDIPQFESAKRAVYEAVSVISVVDVDGMPQMDISDEGVFMLRWEREHAGVALFFSGDGLFSFSTKLGPYDYYSSNYTERRVEEGLPQWLIRNTGHD